MNAQEFVEKTGEMRAAQKRYFTEGRKQADLIEAKRLEKLVDVALAEAVELDEQIGLFDEPDAGDMIERLR